MMGRLSNECCGMVAKKYVLSVAVMVRSVCQSVLAALRSLGGYKIRRCEPIFYKRFDKSS
ncbi:hypothetical protein LU276_08640 [Moraxella haemolytica]|uniref:hypothetical protein n=1 Tax=Moraxella TaxID=475 RepID=UPI002543BA20|nr:hypothetical protein [Moraxella sp. ZY171148]WII95061.1 hypothetical protein LU276_08640 [Moraxella sp. ZY171148]